MWILPIFNKFKNGERLPWHFVSETRGGITHKASGMRHAPWIERATCSGAWVGTLSQCPIFLSCQKIYRSIEEKTIWSCHAPGSWSDVTMCSCQMSLCLAASGGSKKHRNATLKWLHTLKWLWKYIACVLKGKPRSCPLQWILLNYIAVSSWWCAHLSMADSFKDSDDDSVQEVPLSAQFRPPVSWLIIWFSLSAPSIHLGF